MAKKTAAKPSAPGQVAPAAEADWTVLVYMAGDNDLDRFGKRDLMEMKVVGSSERLHLIVQRDTVGKSMPAARYRLRRDTSLEEDVVDALGEINTGSPDVLEEFLKWGTTTYPARRTMAVLWNHGSGWDDTDIYDEAVRRGLRPEGADPLGPGITRNATPGGRAVWTPNRHAGHLRKKTPFFLTAYKFSRGDDRCAIAFDDDAQDFLDSVEMKRVFQNVCQARGRKFDVIGMDACLMSMVEVGLQLRDSGDLLCGSQELEPGPGWPYDRILQALVKDTTVDGRSLCRSIVHEFVHSYPPSELVTQSAFDLARLDRVQRSANSLGDHLALAFRDENDNVMEATSRASHLCQRYDVQDKAQYVDLWDFCERLCRASTDEKVVQLATETQSAVSACVFANKAPHGSVASSHGLSIYLPHGLVSDLYANLDFAQGGWARFLRARTS